MNQKQNGFNILAALLWLTLAVFRIISLVDSWKIVVNVLKYSSSGLGKFVNTSAVIL